MISAGLGSLTEAKTTKADMFKLFGFGRDKGGSAQDSRPMHDQSTTTRQHNDIQRELVRMVLKETLRMHGIPNSWLTAEVTALTGRARGDDILVRLIVLKWHEPLLKFLPALQQQLIHGLDRFEPSIDHSKYLVSWQFAADCGCPHAQLPDAASWFMENIPSDPKVATPTAPPSIVEWEPQAKSSMQAAPAMGKMPLPVKAVAPPITTAPAPAATAPAPVPVPVSVPAPKPKFDLPPSEMDAMPSAFAPTEPGPLR